MNSSNCLILLTLMLYEAQYTYGTNHLKNLKSLLSKHIFPSTTDRSIVYQAQPVYDYNVRADDDTVAEWNKREYFMNGNPVMYQTPVNQQSFEKLDTIPGINFGTVLEEKPEANFKFNSEQNSKELLDSGIIYEVNPGINYEGNSEINSEVNSQQALVKDKETEWLLGETTTNEKQPEIVNNNNKLDVFKKQLIQKINSIKSNIKLNNHPIPSPVAEIIESSFLVNEIPCTNKGTIIEKPCTTKSTPTIPITTTETPTTTEKPCTTKSTSTITTTTTETPTTTEKPCTTKSTPTEEPVSPTGSFITENPVICDTEEPPSISTTFTDIMGPSVSTKTYETPGPNIIVSTTTANPNSDTSNVNVNTDCQEPEITNLPQYKIPALPPQQYYYPPLPYPIWLHYCPPPLTHENCFRSNLQYSSNPIPANTFSSKPLTLVSMPYNVYQHPKQKVSPGNTKVINYIQIDARPINSGQSKQWSYYTNNNKYPVYQNPGFSYTPQTLGLETPLKPVLPSSGAVHSTPTKPLINEYPIHNSDLPKDIKINGNQPLSLSNLGQRKQWIDYAYNNYKQAHINPTYFTYITQTPGSEVPFKTTFPKSGTVYSTQTNQPISEYPVDGSVIPTKNIKNDANQPTSAGQAEQLANYDYNNQQLVSSNPPQKSGSEASSETALPNSGAVYPPQNNQPISGYSTDGSVLPTNNFNIDANQPSYPTSAGQAEQWAKNPYNNQHLVSSNPPQTSEPETPTRTALPNSGAIYLPQYNQPITGYPVDSSVIRTTNIQTYAIQPSYPTSAGQAEQWANYDYNNQQLVSFNSRQKSGQEASPGTALPNSGAVYPPQNNQPTAGYPVDSSVIPSENIKIDANQPSYPINSGQAEQWVDYAYNNQQLVSSNPRQKSGQEASSGTALPNSGAVYPSQNNQPIAGYPVNGSILPANNFNINTNQPSYPTSAGQAEQWSNNAYNIQQLVSSNPHQKSGQEASSGTVLLNSGAVYPPQTNQPIAEYPIDGSVIRTTNIKIDANQPSYPINSGQAEQWVDYAYNNQQLVSSNPRQKSGQEASSGTALPNSGVAYPAQNNQPIAGYPVNGSILPANSFNINANQPSYPTSAGQAEQWANYAYNNQQLVSSNPPQTSKPEIPTGTALSNSGAVYPPQYNQPIAGYPVDSSVIPTANINIDASQPSYPINSGQAEQWINYLYNNQQQLSSNIPETSELKASSGTALPNSGFVYPPQYNQPISGYPIDDSVLRANNININANQPSNPTSAEQAEQWTNYAYNNQQLASSKLSQTPGPEALSKTALPGSDTINLTKTNLPIAVYPTDDDMSPPVEQTDVVKQEDIDPNQYYDISSKANGPNTPLRGDIRFGEDYSMVSTLEEPEGDETQSSSLKERRQVVSKNHKQMSVRNTNNVKMPPASTILLASTPVVEQTEAKIPKFNAKVNASDVKPKSSVVQSKSPVVKAKTPAVEIESSTAGKTETPVTKTKKPVSKSNDDINLDLVKEMLRSKAALLHP